MPLTEPSLIATRCVSQRVTAGAVPELWHSRSTVLPLLVSGPITLSELYWLPVLVEPSVRANLPATESLRKQLVSWEAEGSLVVVSPMTRYEPADRSKVAITSVSASKMDGATEVDIALLGPVGPCGPVAPAKAALLQATVDYAIRGDIEPLPMTQRDSVKQMETAPDAATMLRLHAAHLRAINPRSAGIAWTVEHAAASDPAVAKLWQRMNENRAFAVRHTTEQLLRKPGRKQNLRRKHVETAFWVALDWGTYRTLTSYGGVDDDDYEAWLLRYYRDAFLP